MIGKGLARKICSFSNKKGIAFFVCMLFSFLISAGFSVNAQQVTPKPKPRTHQILPNQKPTTTKPVSQKKPQTTKKKTVVNVITHPKIIKKDSAHHTRPIVKKRIDTASILGASGTTNIPKPSAHAVMPQTHSVRKVASIKTPFVKKADPLWEKTLSVPYLPLKAKAIYVMDEEHQFQSKDLLFYIVCGLFLMFGIVRSAFPKYSDGLFQNLFSFSVNKSESSLGQNNLPSLLLNLLFCVSVGLITTLLLVQNKEPNEEFWRIWLLVSGALGIIYLVKFLTIFLSGWVFNASEDAHVYTYVVFTVNKIIGILCLPAILILAFAEQPQWNNMIITIGSIVLICLLLYRYIVTFSVIARNLQLNAFHFFLYLCSVEIIPMLILYKLFFKDLAHWI